MPAIFEGNLRDQRNAHACNHHLAQGLEAVIVVYKVDRLSRSLNDFAQMVNVFDTHNRTYISRILNLMMLAPDVIASILEGTQPLTMQLQDLTAKPENSLSISAGYQSKR